MFQEYLKNFFSDKTNKDSSIVLLGTALNIIAGGLFFIFAPRILGPVNYGLFSTVVATGLLATSVANFGIDTGILKFCSNNSEESVRFLSLAFKLYILLGLTTSAVGIGLSGIIANLLNQPQISFLLKIGFSSTIFFLLTNFYTAALQAKKEFTKAAFINISSNVARIIILVVLSFLVSISLNIITALFFFITIVSVATGKIFLPIKLEKTFKKDLSDFLKFNFFVSTSLIIASVPFDNYLLLKIAGPLATGLYAAPLKFLTFSYQFGGNFSKIIATDLTRTTSIIELEKIVRKSFPVIFLFVCVLIVTFFLSSFVNALFFGKAFQDSVAIMRTLIIGFIFFFLSIIPSSIIIYFLGRSKILLFITLIKYVVYIILLYFLITISSALGAAWAFSIGELLSLMLMTLYVLKEVYYKDVS